ncbi:hypothetical protein AcdelDRAFT_1972 [Acidovorax delafieldii 2AN]|uniref:Uncharacterized protein n=1 Tax=Acidovorax delafieldii 2AN TaxID=573060 RepID=C5T4Z2_ACIDE|nr:hypothetical protein AcdelDRAFT_1972 [Acidovorax delafieldii 2AN]
MASRRSRTRRDKRKPWQDQDDNTEAAHASTGGPHG